MDHKTGPADLRDGAEERAGGDALGLNPTSQVDIVEREQAKEALRQSEDRYRALTESAPDAVIVHRDGQFLYANPIGLMLYGAKTLEHLQTKTVLDLIDPADRAVIAQRMRQGKEGQTLPPWEASVVRLDGRTVPVESRGGRIMYEGKPAVQIIIRDISDRKYRESRIARLTSLYIMLSRVNEAIVRTCDEQSLLGEACLIIGEEGRFPLVWIGQVKGRAVVPVAWWGPAEDYLKETSVETEGRLGQGPTGTCIRENRSVINDDFATNPAAVPWSRVAPRHGFRSSAAFPLRRGKRVIGALTLYAPHPRAFDAEQARLFESLCANVSHALDSIDQARLVARAQEELRESEERFRVIASSTPDHLFVQDRDLRYTFVVNPQLGLTVRDMIGKTDYDILSKEDADRLTEIKRKVLETGTPAHLGVPLVSSAGERQLFEGSYVPRFDAHGRCDGLIGYFRNVTERMRAEEELRQTRDYLESLLNHANTPIIVWDPQSRITRFNRAFESLTGRASSDVLGQSLDLLFPPDRREEARSHIRRAIAGERWEAVEIPIVRVDGTVRTVLWNSATLYAPDGTTVVATIAQGQDITDRKRAEESLRDAERQLRRSHDEP